MLEKYQGRSFFLNFLDSSCFKTGLSKPHFSELTLLSASELVICGIHIGKKFNENDILRKDETVYQKMITFLHTIKF